jgi:HTH-type transcriptional regulator, competence development regulator
MKAMNTDPGWLKRMAEREDGDFVSVGGWVQALEAVETPAGAFRPTRSAFTRLLQLARRERNLTVEEFAEQANIDLEELVSIEHDENYTPTPRTVYQLAQFLELPERKLLALAGLLVAKDPGFNDAAVRFAARSEPVQKLTQEEHKALEEFVSFLHQV